MGNPPGNVVPFRRPAGASRPPFQFPRWLPRWLFVTATGWVLVANIAIWLVMVVLSRGGGIMTGFDPGLTFRFGSLSPSDVPTQPWRLISAAFLHANLMHLAGNMFFIWYVGSRLEDALGRGRWVTLYLLCAIVGSIASFAWHALVTPGSSVGASGALLGLMGAMFVLFYKATGWKSQGTQMWFRYAVIGFVITAVLNLTGGSPVDNAAHIGGWLAGIGMGWLFAGRAPWPAALNRAAAIAGCVLAIGSVGASLVFADRSGAAAQGMRPGAVADALLAMQKGDLATAEKKLAEAIREKPDDPEVRMLRAQLLAQLGRSEDARAEVIASEALLAAAARRSPSDLAARAAHAQALLALDRRDDARAAVLAAVREASTSDANVWAAVAAALHELGEKSAAVDAAKKAYGRNPRYKDLYYGLKGDAEGAPPKGD